MRTAVQKYKPEKHEKYPKIGKWQLGVCLSLIQVGGCADGRLSPPVTLGAARLGRRDKHTPGATQYNQKARKQSDDGRGVAAEPLGVRPAHTVAQTFVLYRLLWLAFRRVICRRPCPLFLYLLPIYRNRFQTVCLVLPDTSQTRFPRNFSLSPPIPGLYRAKFPLR